MTGPTPSTDHSAAGAALGFWYQSLYALLLLAGQSTDDAAVGIEQLDDIELTADGRTLLYQLKHSIGLAPPPVSVKSRSLWRTVKVWKDVMPQISLSETTFCLELLPLKLGHKHRSLRRAASGNGSRATGSFQVSGTNVISKRPPRALAACSSRSSFVRCIGSRMRRTSLSSTFSLSARATRVRPPRRKAS